MTPQPEPRLPRGPAVPPADLPRMSLLEHLEELRRRLVWSLAALAGGLAATLAFSPEIVRFLAQPIYRVMPPGSKLAFLGVTDPFMLYFKVALLAGAFLAFPLILWQVWLFVSPGLYPSERRWAGPFIFCGWLFFVLGGAFAYYVAFPFTVEFLLDVGKDFQAVITADRYFSFLLTIVLGLGLMFELPILMVLLAAIGLVTPRFLLRHFRWAVLIIFLVSAVITPTADVVNLCLFAVPTIVLYLLGIAGTALVASAKRKRDAS